MWGCLFSAWGDHQTGLKVYLTFREKYRLKRATISTACRVLLFGFWAFLFLTTRHDISIDFIFSFWWCQSQREKKNSSYDVTTLSLIMRRNSYSSKQEAAAKRLKCRRMIMDGFSSTEYWSRVFRGNKIWPRDNHNRIDNQAIYSPGIFFSFLRAFCKSFSLASSSFSPQACKSWMVIRRL